MHSLITVHLPGCCIVAPTVMRLRDFMRVVYGLVYSDKTSYKIFLEMAGSVSKPEYNFC